MIHKNPTKFSLAVFFFWREPNPISLADTLSVSFLLQILSESTIMMGNDVRHGVWLPC